MKSSSCWSTQEPEPGPNGVGPMPDLSGREPIVRGKYRAQGDDSLPAFWSSGHALLRLYRFWAQLGDQVTCRTNDDG